MTNAFAYTYKISDKEESPIFFNNTYFNFKFPGSLGDILVVPKDSDDFKDSFSTFFTSVMYLALYELTGVTPFDSSLRGDIYQMGIDTYAECTSPPYFRMISQKLMQINDPLLLQSGLNISQGYYNYDNNELSAYYFFLAIEALIKYLVFNNILSNSEIVKIRINKGYIFTDELKASLQDILSTRTIDIIWEIKDIRNKFLFHGGVRGYLTEIGFEDPENSAKEVAKKLKHYMGKEDVIKSFLAFLKTDIEFIARLLFFRAIHFKPFFIQLPVHFNEYNSIYDRVAEDESIDFLSPHDVDGVTNLFRSI